MNSLGFGVGDIRDQSTRVDIASILSIARQHLNQGDPTAALQAVVAALRNIGGEEAVTSALRRAGQMHEHGTRADELTALFAQCAIATFPPPPLSSSPSAANPPEHMSVETTSQGNVVDPIGSSILAESGREQVVLDASADGSSFLCPQCCGVVSNSRRDEHFAYWCSGTPRSM